MKGVTEHLVSAGLSSAVVLIVGYFGLVTDLKTDAKVVQANIEYIKQSQEDIAVSLAKAVVKGDQAVEKWVKAQLDARDIKIDLSFLRATQGARFTAEDGKQHAARIEVLERDMHSESRFSKQGEKLEKRIDKLEAKINERH